MFKINKITKKIDITQGDSARFRVDVKTKDGKQYKITQHDTIKFTVRKTANSEALIEYAVKGNNEICLVPEATKLLASGLYLYDIELSNLEMVNTIIPLSFFEIHKEVTQ